MQVERVDEGRRRSSCGSTSRDGRRRQGHRAARPRRARASHRRSRGRRPGATAASCSRSPIEPKNPGSWARRPGGAAARAGREPSSSSVRATTSGGGRSAPPCWSTEPPATIELSRRVGGGRRAIRLDRRVERGAEPRCMCRSRTARTATTHSSSSVSPWWTRRAGEPRQHRRGAPGGRQRQPRACGRHAGAAHRRRRPYRRSRGSPDRRRTRLPRRLTNARRRRTSCAAALDRLRAGYPGPPCASTSSRRSRMPGWAHRARPLATVLGWELEPGSSTTATRRRALGTGRRRPVRRRCRDGAARRRRRRGARGRVRGRPPGTDRGADAAGAASRPGARRGARRNAELALLSSRFEGFDERIVEPSRDRRGVDRAVRAVGRRAAGDGRAGRDRTPPARRARRGLRRERELLRELDGGLEYPHYTRPAAYRGWEVPDVLLSGDHGRIDRWRREQSRSRSLA